MTHTIQKTILALVACFLSIYGSASAHASLSPYDQRAVEVAAIAKNTQIRNLVLELYPAHSSGRLDSIVHQADIKGGQSYEVHSGSCRLHVQIRYQYGGRVGPQKFTVDPAEKMECKSGPSTPME